MARPSRVALLLSTTLALGLGGCVTRGGNETGVGMAPPSPGTSASVAEAAQHWGERFQRNPGDEQVAFAYARALLAQDQRAQAVAVLQRAVLANRGSRFLQGELGKALAANGQLNEALNVFGQAHTPDRPDWRILSAQGAVLDQLGRPDEARRSYEAALRIAPGEPAVLSNFGLSHALTGDLHGAERHLRSAMQHPRADERVRQNLALVVGLQGRFRDAEEIARRDLPPDKAEQNVAMIRRMLRANSQAPARPADAAALLNPRERPAQERRGTFAAHVLAEEAARASDQVTRPPQSLLTGTATSRSSTTPGGAGRSSEPTSLLGTTSSRQERVSPEQARRLLGS
jgi:Flp pilus assembly protein TadD